MEFFDLLKTEWARAEAEVEAVVNKVRGKKKEQPAETAAADEASKS